MSLFFNQQANIKNVNGAIADTIANRPAAQSTYYIFYSTDTQEIFYDNGSWVLLGSGGGGVNIYNSDGTLTGNRTLNAANSTLNISDVNNFLLSSNNNDTNIFLDEFAFLTRYQGNDIGLKLDFPNSTYQFGQINQGNITFLSIDDINERLQTRSNTNLDGLDFDFANEIFKFGQFDSTNGVHIKINGFAGVDLLQTIYSNNEQGLELQFNNRIYRYGHLTGGKQSQINIDDTLQSIIFESSYNIPGEEIRLIIKGGANSLISTQYQQITTGIQLDFIGRQYNLGEIATNNQTYLSVNDNNSLIITHNQGNEQGLYIDYNALIYCLGISDGNDFYNTITGYKLDASNSLITIGDTWAVQPTYLEIDYSINQTIKTSNQGNDQGLKLDFANGLHSLGQNDVGILADVNNQQTIIGDYNNFNNLLKFIVDDINNYVKTSFLGNDIGLKLDFANNTYQFGQLTGGNATFIEIDDSLKLIYGKVNGNLSGIYLDESAKYWAFGSFQTINGTQFVIDDTVAYPLQIDGTNVLSGTSGGNSGQHLKIKINGVDYKIKLENP